VAISLREGKLQTVFDPNPQFAAFELDRVEKIEWHDAFGNPTFGHLVLPPNDQKGKGYPLVIVQYRSVAEGDGHSVATMLKTYAAWTKGAIAADVELIKRDGALAFAAIVEAVAKCASPRRI
jgi:hypothetical protein